MTLTAALVDRAVPDRALRWQCLTREPMPWFFRYHGGLLDGRRMVHLGAGIATVLPLVRSDGSFAEQRYAHKFRGEGVIDAYFDE